MSDVDVWVMALPNGVAKPWIDAIEEGSSESVIIDLSADYRFDSAWIYGLPELIDRSKIAKATRISNPGCYAVSSPKPWKFLFEIRKYTRTQSHPCKENANVMVFRRRLRSGSLLCFHTLTEMQCPLLRAFQYVPFYFQNLRLK